MKRETIGKILASGAAVILLTSGCSLPGKLGIGSASSSQMGDKAAIKLAKKAEKSFKKGRYEEAVQYAEDAVFADPQNAEMRVLLGNSYFADGRFASAEQAFEDSRSLGDANPRSVISLALAYTAQGKTSEARNLLNANRTDLPAADYGLALALNGDTDLSIRVLVDAIQNGEPDSRTRQNLAFAYAMAGRWQDASMMAQQDLAPSDMQNRMVEWAQLARPGAYGERVASILGIPAKDDAGMPATLALNASSSNMNYAAAEERDVVVPLPSSNPNYGTASLAAIGPAPSAGGGIDFKSSPNIATPVSAKPVMAPVFASAPAPKLATVPVVVAKPVEAPSAQPKALKPIVEDRDAPSKRSSAIATPKAAPAPVSPKPANIAAPKAASQPAKASGGGAQYIVQLGAYSSEEAANRAWGQHSKRYSGLTSFGNASSSATVNGKRVYRLAATGFGNAQSANDMCSGIKAKGGDCIVRKVSGIKAR